MSKFLDPSGHSTYGIGLCARCSRKRSLDDLTDDPNTPGLKVCAEGSGLSDSCVDNLDPYRLAPRVEDPIALRFNRPDEKLTV